MTDDEEVLRRFTPEEATQRRAAYLEEHVTPHVRRVFERHPDLRSALLLVAQYWNDEAEDAVHSELVFSVLDSPDVEAASENLYDDVKPDRINLPPGLSHSALQDSEVWLHWDDNGEAIPLFAAFTKEGCDQEMSLGEAYSPYALFRRTAAGIDVAIVGTMLRPWLDGVWPEEEV